MSERVGSTIAEGIVDRLRTEIREGKLKPGEFLRQNIIAERYGVSSTPVREALALLEREGLVRREPHRGVVVFQPTIDDLLDCYEIREALEVLAVRKAVRNLTPEDVAYLSDLAARMKATNDLQEYMLMNQEFHERIERAAGSERLFELIAAQRVAATTYLAFMGIGSPTADETADEHQSIVEAIASGVPSLAANAMSQHLRTRAEALSHRLRRMQGAGQLASAK
jgi:DNA-binding GntR family transcriptional regulator